MNHLRALHKPLGIILLWCSRDLRGALNLSPMMPKGASLKPIVGQIAVNLEKKTEASNCLQKAQQWITNVASLLIWYLRASRNYSFPPLYPSVQCCSLLFQGVTRGLLKWFFLHLNPSVQCCSRSFRGLLIWAYMMPKPLGRLYAGACTRGKVDKKVAWKSW